MNMTSRPVFPAKDSREYILPLVTSGNAKGGAGVPSGSMRDAMAMIAVPFFFPEDAARSWLRQVPKNTDTPLLCDWIDQRALAHASTGTLRLQLETNRPCPLSA